MRDSIIKILETKGTTITEDANEICQLIDNVIEETKKECDREFVRKILKALEEAQKQDERDYMEKKR